MAETEFFVVEDLQGNELLRTGLSQLGARFVVGNQRDDNLFLEGLKAASPVQILYEWLGVHFFVTVQAGTALTVTAHQRPLVVGETVRVDETYVEVGDLRLHIEMDW